MPFPMTGVISISSLLSDTPPIEPTEISQNEKANSNILDPKQLHAINMNKSKSPMSVSSLMNDPVVRSEEMKSFNTMSSTEAYSNPPNLEKNGSSKIVRKKPSNNDTQDANKNVNDTKNKKSKSNEQVIVDIEIPLSTHNDVHHEHNFVKLVEEKYGRYDAGNNVPLARTSWNDDDGEDEDDEDEDEEQEGEENGEREEEEPDLESELHTANTPSTINNNTPTDSYYDDEDEIVKALKIKFTAGMNDAEKESLVLKEIHRRKMVNNKRIGKYDVDDPFIDDEELEYEEDTNSNIDGWFIWSGKLDTTQQKKKSEQGTKTEKNARTTTTTRNRPVSSSGSNQRRQREPANSPQPQKKQKKAVLPIATSKTPASISVSSGSKTSPSKTENKTTPEKKDTTDKEPAKSTPQPPSSNIIIGSFGF